MKRGRKSKAETETKLTVIDGGFSGQRPEPPAGMTGRQAEIWNATVNDEPPDFFATSATQEMLKDYCYHRFFAEMVTATMNQFEPSWLKSEKGAKRFHYYSKMLDTHTNRAAMLATKLRLTNQSRYMPRAAASASANTIKGGNRPWDWDPPMDG